MNRVGNRLGPADCGEQLQRAAPGQPETSVISHSIATIGVQAGVAAHVLDEHPEQAREALLAIKTISRYAMRDFRGMLSLLRQADDTDGRDPAPGRARLP